MFTRSVLAFAIAGLAGLALTGNLLVAQNPAGQAPAVDFARDIQPILQDHCYDCHGAKKTKNGLRLDLRAAALK